MEKSKFYRIKNITEREYTLVGCDGSVITCPIQDVDKSASAFTIQDAKDGDVLVSQYNKPFIYNGNLDSFLIGSYCGISTEGRFNVATEKCRWTRNSNIHPATKEQRDTLMKAMSDAGWVFDFEKKELKKISQRMVSAEAKEAMYSKPTDLEVFINELSKQFPDVSFAKLSRIAVRVAKWAKPTDEEMKELLRTEYEKGRADAIAETQNPAWSEEDENAALSIEQVINCASSLNIVPEKVDKIRTWLKSLKDRVQHL